ncbi:MAG: hypothetical protein JWQ01_4923 [Massilia sp.]|nr:hypothetical protein [Massilia sp.]
MKTAQAPIPRNERFILAEYAAHGFKPVLLTDGRPMSMQLARQLGHVLEKAE